jgi:hypothetical protein
MKPHDAAITAYLASLRAAGNDLPPDIADELIADVRSHLEEVAATDAGDATIRQAIDDLGSPEQIVAAARTELLTPGSGPVEIDTSPGAPAVATDRAVATGPAAPGGQTSPRDALTVFLILLGPLLALLVVRPLVVLTENMPTIVLIIVFALAIALAGTVLLWTATIWTTNEKLLGTLVWPGGLLAPLALGVLPGETCITEVTTGQESVTTCTGFALPLPIGLLLLMVLVIGPIVVAVTLLKRAGRRRMPEADAAVDANAPT